jgi:hypothetical protein
MTLPPKKNLKSSSKNGGEVVVIAIGLYDSVRVPMGTWPHVPIPRIAINSSAIPDRYKFLLHLE